MCFKGYAECDPPICSPNSECDPPICPNLEWCRPNWNVADRDKVQEIILTTFIFLYYSL